MHLEGFFCHGCILDENCHINIYNSVVSDQTAEMGISHEATSLTDRLLGHVGIDQRVERNYQVFERALVNFEQNDKLQRWFVEYFNGVFKDLPRYHDPILMSDIRSLRLDTNNPDVDALKRRYGNDYHRPILTLDLSEYKLIARKLRGETSSNAMALSEGAINDSLLTRGLTLVVSGGGISGEERHELRHTIDPNRDKRIGQDRILEEFAAFWGNVVDPIVRIQKTTHRDGERVWVETQETVATSNSRMVGLEIKSNVYFRQYRKQFPSEEEFYKFVDKVMGIINKLSAKYDRDQIDRILLNTRSVQELSELAEEKTPD